MKYAGEWRNARGISNHNQETQQVGKAHYAMSLINKYSTVERHSVLPRRNRCNIRRKYVEVGAG